MSARRGARILRGTLAAVVSLGLFGACENGGADRTAGIAADGVVRGEVFFDSNGSGTRDEGDVAFGGAALRLVSPVTRDTLFRMASGEDGSFTLPAVPVGSYELVLGAASLGDTAVVTAGAGASVRVLPGDTAAVTVAIGFPSVSIAEARTLPVGSPVFVTGVALHARSTFSDTLLHVVDDVAAIRATRVRPSPVAAGDSVRLRARIGQRFGEPALDDVTVFVILPTFIPPVPTIASAAAATADGGAADAALVRILDAEVMDSVTVNGDLVLTVDDGSGAVEVRLDRTADPGFRPPFAPGMFAAGSRFDVIGILVPDGAGAWQVRPRSVLDLIER